MFFILFKRRLGNMFNFLYSIYKLHTMGDISHFLPTKVTQVVVHSTILFGPGQHNPIYLQDADFLKRINFFFSFSDA